MITGTVNAGLEAIVRVVVFEAGSEHNVEAVIDTGFSGDLTLPPEAIVALGLNWLGREEGILADGTVSLFDVYSASLLWNGQVRAAEVEAVDAQPLVGMNLLERHSLRMDVVNGGTVTITPLP